MWLSFVLASASSLLPSCCFDSASRDAERARLVAHFMSLDRCHLLDTFEMLVRRRVRISRVRFFEYDYDNRCTFERDRRTYYPVWYTLQILLLQEIDTDVARGASEFGLQVPEVPWSHGWLAARDGKYKADFENLMVEGRKKWGCVRTNSPK